MQIAFLPQAWDDYIYWQATEIEMVYRINVLIKDIKRESFKGLGKPEPLKANMSGYWSRRINGEHRLVYRISGSKPDQILTILQVRLHY